MNNGRALLGAVLAALGVVLLLDQMDLVDAGAVIGAWWPLVIVAAGALAFVGRPRAVGPGGVVLAVGLALLAMTTGLFGVVGWGVVWAVGLIGLGAWLALGRRLGTVSATDEAVDATVVFSGREIRSSARPFRGGSVTALFGGVELDLTGAELQDGAALDAVGVFGGVDVLVPHGWRVQMNGPAIFGGYDNEAEGLPIPDGAPTLHIRALALFGGVSVKVRVVPSTAAPSGVT